jgi:hypothetical protein
VGPDPARTARQHTQALQFREPFPARLKREERNPALAGFFLLRPQAGQRQFLENRGQSTVFEKSFPETVL